VVAPIKTRLSACFPALLVLAPTRPALLTTHMIGRIASTRTTLASVAAHGPPRRPFHSLHASLAPTTTQLALMLTPPTGRLASTHITPVLMVAHGLLTIRSLL
jgi:hypothetical protein